MPSVRRRPGAGAGRCWLGAERWLALGAALALTCRPAPRPSPPAPAGATSAAIKKSNSGLTQKLSGFASLAALALGGTMVLAGLGIELPFALPPLPFLGGHAH